MKKIKKILLTFAFVFISAVGISAVACDGENPTLSQNDEKKSSIILNVDAVSLDLGETFTVLASLNNVTGEIVWESSNPAVATIDQNGFITALADGITTISATCGETTAKCYVTVINHGYIPVVVVEDKQITLMEGDSYDLNAKLVMQNKELDAQFTYESSDTGVVEITAGVVTAKQAGVASVTLSTLYDGISYTETVEISVIEEMSIQAERNSVTLYTSDLTGGATTAEIGYVVSGLKNADVSVICESEYVTATKQGEKVYIQAVRAGTAQVKVQFTNGGITYDSIITVVCEKPTYDAGEVYAKTDSSVNGKMEIALGESLSVVDLKSVEINGESVTDYMRSEDGVSVDCDILQKGENLFRFSFDNVEVQGSVVLADTIIKDKAGLDAFIRLLASYGKGTENMQSKELYVVLADDIDYQNGNLVTSTGRTNYDTNWCGVFDGRGHVISNLTVDRGGVFGYIRGGTVKNLGLVNIQSDKAVGDTGGLLCMLITGGGLIDNCFVQGSFKNASKTTGGALAEFAYNGNTVRNCITAVSGAKFALCGQENSNFVIPKFSYAISSDAVYAYRTTEDVLYQSSVACISAVKTLSVDDGWAKQWKMENGKLAFGSYELENVETLTGVMEIMPSKNSTVTVDLSNYNVTEITALSIGGIEVNGFTFEKGVVAIASKWFTEHSVSGDCTVEISAICGETPCVFIQNTVVITHVITTAKDLDDFVKLLVSYGKGGTNLQSSAIYAVLASDINYNGGNLVTNTGRMNFDTNWCGVFDGRGHVISNLTVDRGGVFGYIRGGTVKNLGLVNITSNKAAKDTGGLLCMMLTGGGRIDNCFVQGSFTNASATTGAGIAEFAYGGNVITNCFTVVSGAKYAVSGQEAASFVTPQYCYAVSADATYAYKTTGTENVLFKTMSAFTENRLGMPVIGWNSQWKIENGQIVFGSYKTTL